MDCILTRITIGQRACRSPKGGSSYSGFDLFPRLSMDKLQVLHGSPGAAHLEQRRLTPPQRIGKTPKLQIPPCNVLPVFQGPTFGSCSTLAGAEPRHRPFLDRTQPLRHTSSAELSPVSTTDASEALARISGRKPVCRRGSHQLTRSPEFSSACHHKLPIGTSGFVRAVVCLQMPSVFASQVQCSAVPSMVRFEIQHLVPSPRPTSSRGTGPGHGCGFQAGGASV